MNKIDYNYTFTTSSNKSLTIENKKKKYNLENIKRFDKQEM
jgi:hypothetical protein